MTITNTFSSGVNTNFSTELNTNFTEADNRGIKEVYTGTGFDISVSGALQDTSNSHELTAITSSDLSGMNYLTIDSRVIVEQVSDQSAAATLYLKIETKEIGGSYSNSFPETIVFQTNTDGASTNVNDRLKNYLHTHTLTAGEKSNGVQVRITYRVTTGNDAGNESSVTNHQTIQRTDA